MPIRVVSWSQDSKGENVMDKKYLEEKVIYEKTYPQEDIDELHAAMSEEDAAQDESENKRMTFDEILDEIYDGVEYEPLPEREKSAELFVKTAINISETYELDVKIVKHYSHISVDFCFNSSGCMGFLKHIIRFADDISFFANIKGYEIVMSIDHYTHAETRHGRRVHP